MYQKDFEKAQSLIESFPTETTDEQNFKAIQEINLAWQTAGPGFVLSEEQVSDLNDIIASRTQSAAYAKSLLSILNQVIFDPELPEFVRERSSNKIDPAKRILPFALAPNPASYFVKITVPKYEDEPNGLLFIFDLNGRLIKKMTIKTAQDITVVTQDWENGIYFVKFVSGNGLVQNAKFVVHN